jgi:hypothetical protein
MDHQVVPAPELDGGVTLLDPLRDQATRYATGATAAATRTAYRLDWACFAVWTASHGLDALPAQPETVGLYLFAMTPTLQVSTLERRLAAIAIAHRLAGHQLAARRSATSCAASAARMVAPGARPPRRRWTW